MPFQLEAVLLDRGEVRALVDDGDILARERELRRQQAADGARADHADLLRFGRRAQQIGARQHLVENIAEAADAVDHDVDDVVGVAHGAGAERGAAGDDVARHQRDVLGNRGDQLVRREEHVGDRIVLPFLAVQDGLDRQFHRVDAGRDHRTEHAEGVEAFRARPLLERLVLAQQIDGGDVVHAGVAEDIIAGLGLRDVEAFLADDDAKLALVDDLSGIGRRALDRPVGGPIGIRRLEEPERLFRLLEIVLGRELVEIIPQADHFRWIAGRQNLNVGELQRLAGRLGAGEHIAAVNRDGVSFQRTNAGLAALLEADPFCHLRPPGAVKAASFDRAALWPIVIPISILAIMHCIIGKAEVVGYTVPNKVAADGKRRLISEGCHAGAEMVEA